MSDQEFKGLNPKSKAGESIFFYSMDYWIRLCECFLMVCNEDFDPFAALDEKRAEELGETLQLMLDSGLFKACFQRSAIDSHDDEDEAADFVETMLDYAAQYIDFLKNCGGCEPV